MRFGLHDPLAGFSRTPDQPVVAVLATLETKAEETDFVLEQIHHCNAKTQIVLIDTSRTTAALPPPRPGVYVVPRVDHDDDDDDDEAGPAPERDVYARAMTTAAAAVLRALWGRRHRRAGGDDGTDEADEDGADDDGDDDDDDDAARDLHGVLGLGGSTGSAIAAGAMRALPVGLPKLLVSTMASGDVGPLVDGVDLTLMYSVVDIAGLNFVSRRVLANAAAAVAGMAGARHAVVVEETAQKADKRRSAAEPKRRRRKYRVAVTMFGVTTPAVDRVRRRLTDEDGAEVVVFHATGAGGRTLERMVAGGAFDAVADLTTTEVADEVAGGVLSAGPDRLAAGARAGVPYVVSAGACDVVNFGPRATVPAAVAAAAARGERRLHPHNPAVTLLRTSADESRRVGAALAAPLAAAVRPDLVRVLLPGRGLSLLGAAPDGPFADAAADAALFAALEHGLAGSGVAVQRHDDLALNDPAFADAVVDALRELRDRKAAVEAAAPGKADC